MDNIQRSMEPICFETVIKGLELTHSGETAVLLKNTLKELAVAPSVIRRVAIAAYEMEMNIAIHAREGLLTATVNPGCVEIIAEDKGPGICDIDQAMQEGYSTATEDFQRLGFGGGMGLPNIKRNADIFEIDSYSNNGTKLKVKMFFR